MPRDYPGGPFLIEARRGSPVVGGGGGSNQSRSTTARRDAGSNSRDSGQELALRVAPHAQDTRMRPDEVRQGEYGVAVEGCGQRYMGGVSLSHRRNALAERSPAGAMRLDLTNNLK
ncbi:hypothetical protein CCP4SC76_5890002 [Gammaproteobacteria bacterium]